MAEKFNITKRDLVEAVSKQTGITQVEVKMIVEKFLEYLVQGLTEGNNVEFRGFGRFKLKNRKERCARNPRTGALVRIEPGIKPTFEPSKELLNVLNEHLILIKKMELEIVDG